MKISVIIPCYNAGFRLTEALDSVAAQIFSPYEVIVIDDGSTDDSIERAKSHPVQPSILHTTRAHAGGARNAGMAVAKGDWIALLDADDRWQPNHLSLANELLSGSNDVGCLSGFNSFEETTGKIFPAVPLLDAPSPRAGIPAEEYVELFLHNGSWGTSGCLFRRDIIGKGFDMQLPFGEDLEFWLRIIHGKTWAYQPRSTALYRVNSPSSIGAGPKLLAKGRLYILLGLQKVEAKYPTRAMADLMVVMARRVMSAAFTDGTAEDRRLNHTVAWPYLSKKDKIIFGFFGIFPMVFRLFNRLRRRFILQY
jgi:glycosyltransferase involved in cell wall biosynthesis